MLGVAIVRRCTTNSAIMYSVVYMDKDDVYCLQCGYNLRGIPQRRCPECGFGYDHAAVRYFSRQQNWNRDDAVRRVVSSFTLSLAILVSPMTWTFAQRPVGGVGAVYAAWLAALLLNRFVVYRNSRLPTLSLSHADLFVGVIKWSPVPAVVLTMAPILALIAATVVCPRSWLIFIRTPECFPHAFRMQADRKQRQLRVLTAIAITGQVVVSMLVLVLWSA